MSVAGRIQYFALGTSSSFLFLCLAKINFLSQLANDFSFFKPLGIDIVSMIHDFTQDINVWKKYSAKIAAVSENMCNFVT